jgi:hypothetical protein
MESQLLQIILALMQEHKLRRDVIFSLSGLRFINFNREVPNCHLIIGRGNSQNRVFTRLELQTCNCLCVPPDTCNGIEIFLVEGFMIEHAQVPNTEFTLVVS